MNATQAQGERTRLGILAAVRWYERTYGRSPTIRQIGQIVRPAQPLSTGLVSYHLKLLEARGTLAHVPGQNRTYHTVGAATAAGGP